MFTAEDVVWLGHASFQIKAEKIIYIDPWNLKINDPADIVLVTHSHYDHCSAADISKIQKTDTIIVAAQDCRDKLFGNVRFIHPGEHLEIKGIEIEAVPAYNIAKSFHPRAKNGVGYIINLEAARIYHAGDSDFVPEMSTLKADIALLPIGGTYTMNPQEAAELVNKIKPKLAIPMHYGSIVGDAKDAEMFKQLCHTEVKILKP